MITRYHVLMLVIAVSLAVGPSIVDGETSSTYALDNLRSIERMDIDLDSMLEREHGTTVHHPVSSIVDCDIDADGIPELFFYADGVVVQYSLLDDEYRVIFDTGNNSRHKVHSPQFSDLDFDGTVECIIYDWDNTCIRCFDMSTYQEEWNLSFDTRRPNVNPYPKIVSNETSRTSQILVAFAPDGLMLVDGEGQQIWSKRIESPISGLDGKPYVGIADTDYDGDLEYVFVSSKRIGPDSHIYFEIGSLHSSKALSSWT